MNKWLIAGLGNPGSEYAETRHNVGFLVVDELARRWGMALTRRRFSARMDSGRVAGVEAVLLKPQTFMNLSGQSVGPARGFLKVPLEQVLVVHDDIDLPLGRLRVKDGGGHGGHNGLRSLTQCLGDGGYPRVRVGVGRPDRGRVVGHVLGRFDDDEGPTREEIVDRAADAVEEILRRGIRSAMNRFNGPLPVKTKAEPGGGA